MAPRQRPSFNVTYSFNNTVRNVLWLPTSRRAKSLAKQASDTFFVRVGDVSSAALVFFGVRQLGMPVRAIAVVNGHAGVGMVSPGRGHPQRACTTGTRRTQPRESRQGRSHDRTADRRTVRPFRSLREVNRSFTLQPSPPRQIDTISGAAPAAQ